MAKKSANTISFKVTTEQHIYVQCLFNGVLSRVELVPHDVCILHIRPGTELCFID